MESESADKDSTGSERCYLGAKTPSERVEPTYLTVEKPWRDEATLRRLYVGQELTCAEVAERLGCSLMTVSRWKRRFGLENDIRPGGYKPYASFYHLSEPNAAREKWKSGNDYVDVARLLAVAEYGFDAVAGMHVHHKNRVAWDNRPDNIELLEPTEHLSMHGLQDQESGPWRDPERLQEGLQSKSQDELAREWGCSAPTILRWRKKYGISLDGTRDNDSSTEGI